MSAAADTRNESGMAILYRNCSDKNLGGAEYIDLENGLTPDLRG